MYTILILDNKSMKICQTAAQHTDRYCTVLHLVYWTARTGVLYLRLV